VPTIATALDETPGLASEPHRPKKATDLPQTSGVVAAAKCRSSVVAAPEIEMLELGTARDPTRMFEDA
jgi:hypothetical protein